MALQKPKSMVELDYYTRRVIGEKGKAEVWVFKQRCHCGGLFRKQKKTAKEYICDSCGKSVPKVEYELKQVANVRYTCPACGRNGEKQEPFKRKKVSIIIDGKKKQVPTFQFMCDSCGEKINITKKMK